MMVNGTRPGRRSFLRMNGYLDDDLLAHGPCNIKDKVRSREACLGNVRDRRLPVGAAIE